MNGPHFDLSPRPWWERVPAELVAEYVELVHDTRHLQNLHRRTQDPLMRRELPALEQRLDDLTDRLRAALGHADAEGGAA